MSGKGSTSTELEIPFRLESITEAGAPAGEQGLWHAYVIRQGTNTITGLRSGTREEIRVLVEAMVERLNERFGKQQAKQRR